MRTDQILLDATTSVRDVDALVASLRAGHATGRGVVVPPVFARRAVEALRGSGVRVASVAGYPLGLAKPTVKAIEATSLAKDGVDAIELTPLPATILAGEFDALRAELLEVVRGVRAAQPTTSVHVRLDLNVLGLATRRLTLLTSAIEQGACDGIILETADPATLDDVVPAWPVSSLELKLQSRLGTAHLWPAALAIGVFCPSRAG